MQIPFQWNFSMHSILWVHNTKSTLKDVVTGYSALHYTKNIHNKQTLKIQLYFNRFILSASNRKYATWTAFPSTFNFVFKYCDYLFPADLQ